MIQTSTKWKEYSRDIGTFHIKAVIDNGTSMTLTDSDFMQGSVSITDSVSGMSEFTVGAVVTNTFNGTLNNFDGKFNNYTLGGARLTVQFGIVYEDGTEEWINRGIYTLEKPTSLGSTIKVTGYDDMDKLNRYYIGKYRSGNTLVDFTFPISASTFAQRICEYCGATFGSWNLASANIDEFEYNESTTCRQVLGWLVQSFGGYARVNNTGSLEIKTFNKHEWSSGTTLDGGTINPWSSVSTYNGGTISPWSAVTDYNGGVTGGAEFTLSKIKSLDVYVEDITITGVRAFAYNTVDEFEFDTVGSSGYVLAIQDNPLVTDNTLTVATRVNNAVNGLTFRPFDANIYGDPSIEAGDAVALKDYLGNEHISIITSLTYSVNQAERLECNAKTPEEADLATANPQTSVIQGAVTAAYDYVIAKKISADAITAGTLGVNGKITASDLEITGGDIGGFSIINGRITTPYTIPHTYTSSDSQRAFDIAQGYTTPTQTDYELYDINGDGEIDGLDVDLIGTAVSDAGGDITSVISIDPSSYSGGVTMINNLGGGSYLGASSMRSPMGVFDALTLDGTRITDGIKTTIMIDPPPGTIIAPEFSCFGFEFAKGLIWVQGSVDLGNVAMTSSYGSAYYADRTINYPVYLADNPKSLMVSCVSGGGLIGATVYSSTSTGFKVYIYDMISETRHVYLNFSLIGTMNQS